MKTSGKRLVVSDVGATCAELELAAGEEGSLQSA